MPETTILVFFLSASISNMLFLCFLSSELQKDALSSGIGFSLFQLNSNLNGFIPFHIYGGGGKRREKRERKE